MATIVCKICFMPFRKERSLASHLKYVHRKPDSFIESYLDRDKSFQCLEGCESLFKYHGDLIRHLSEAHNMNMDDSEELIFSSIKDFHKFVNNIHESQSIEYVQGRSEKFVPENVKNGEGSDSSEEIKILYFVCNYGEKNDFLKCTSHIEAKINKTKNTVNVKYFKTHYGHELQHLTLPKMEKVASKLSTDEVPMSPKQQQEMQQQQVQQQQMQQQQQVQQQQMQQAQHMQQPPQPLDNISKIKSLMGPLRETLALTMKSAAQALNQNNQIDSGSQKTPDIQIPRFDKNLEEFYSICDQIELHLKTSINCLSQAESSNRYLNVPVMPNRSETIGMNENSLTYPQFLSTVGAQVSYIKEIQETLLAAAQNISPSE